jgi:hypothetical protein
VTAHDGAPEPVVAAIDGPVERLLAAAAADAAWPATPDLRRAVAARIEAPPAPDMRAGVLTRIGDGTGRGGVRIRLLRPLAVAAILVLALAGLAIGLGFDIPGLDLRQVERTPAVPSRLDLGSPVPLGDVLALDEPRVLLPAALPPPDSAFELGVDERRIVSLAWRASPGDPVLEGTDTFLTLMAVPGTTEEPLIMKAAGPGTRLEPIDVDGDPGWWITGAPHEIMIVRPSGEIGMLRSAVVGDTLVFSRDGTLYRLESALGMQATLDIARSLGTR